MSEIFNREIMLIGNENFNILQNAHVAVFGVGGVGGFCAEALARCGIGQVTLVDNDTVAPSNINRQIIALHSTVGMAKVDVMRARLLDINPKLKINGINCFFNAENADDFDFSLFDYVVDAIDTVTSKLILVEKCEQCKTPIISSMGAGNKLDATSFKVADIFKTSVCPLARVMRGELRKRGIEHLKVVYSQEKPLTPSGSNEKSERRSTPGSIAFVPSVVGLIIGGEVVKDLINLE